MPPNCCDPDSAVLPKLRIKWDTKRTPPSAKPSSGGWARHRAPTATTRKHPKLKETPESLRHQTSQNVFVARLPARHTKYPPGLTPALTSEKSLRLCEKQTLSVKLCVSVSLWFLSGRFRTSQNDYSLKRRFRERNDDYRDHGNCEW